MEIPGVGELEFDDELGWWISDLVPVPALDGAECSIILVGYDDDPAKEEFLAAIRNFLSISPSVLRDAAPHIFEYYKACNKHREPGSAEYVDIASPEGVWAHIRFGFEAHVSRRSSADKGVYISLASNCDWEPEHGLQIVFKNGLVVNKIGAFDDHVTNSDAYGDENLEDVIFHSPKM